MGTQGAQPFLDQAVGGRGDVVGGGRGDDDKVDVFGLKAGAGQSFPGRPDSQIRGGL